MQTNDKESEPKTWNKQVELQTVHLPLLLCIQRLSLVKPELTTHNSSSSRAYKKFGGSKSYGKL
jgi:hypothetical protein